MTASPLLNFYIVLLLKIYDQRRQLDIPIKDVMISRNVVYERVKRLKRSRVTVIQLNKTIHLRVTKPGDGLGSWLSQFVSVSFFYKKICFFQFLLLLN